MFSKIVFSLILVRGNSELCEMFADRSSDFSGLDLRGLSSFFVILFALWDISLNSIIL